MDFILALDQGTTSSRAILFDRHGAIQSLAQLEFKQIYPAPGWVEHDPAEIWQTQQAVALAALNQAGASAKNVAAVAITNQRETAILWDRATGKPLANAIVWQDRRTADFCAHLTNAGHADAIRAKTGLVIDPYFSASKIRWLLQNIPGAKIRAAAGEIAFGTVDTWLLWNLTAGKVHATDPSNASRTMLYNIHQQRWDEDLLKLFDIPRQILPEVKPSSGLFGDTAPALLGDPIPIAGIAGDQQAALFGQTCFSPGLAKCTYGTGCFILINAGQKPPPTSPNLLTTIAWQTSGTTDFALEGSVFIGGAVVQWLRDGLGLIHSAAEVEALAASVPDNGGVYFVPAFNGLGTPHWDPAARGTILGLTRGTTAAHLARAALEAIAFQVADVLDVMRREAALDLPQLRVDGGAAQNNLLLQFQADILQVPVVRPKITESTALGAAYLAGLAVAFWKSRDQIQSHCQIDRTFTPQMPPTHAAHLLQTWRRAVDRSRHWQQSPPPPSRWPPTPAASGGVDQ